MQPFGAAHIFSTFETVASHGVPSTWVTVFSTFPKSVWPVRFGFCSTSMFIEIATQHVCFVRFCFYFWMIGRLSKHWQDQFWFWNQEPFFLVFVAYLEANPFLFRLLKQSIYARLLCLIRFSSPTSLGAIMALANRSLRCLASEYEALDFRKPRQVGRKCSCSNVASPWLQVGVRSKWSFFVCVGWSFWNFQGTLWS